MNLSMEFSRKVALAYGGASRALTPTALSLGIC